MTYATAGYPATTVAGLVRAIRDHYVAACELDETTPPTIYFGRRHLRQDAGPNTIVIVPRRGAWGRMTDFGAGQVPGFAIRIEVHVWGPEPEIGDDELENELLRWDSADPLRNRFVNVLDRVASGRYEPIDVDPDAGATDPAAVNEHGEAYVLAFNFLEDVARDGYVALVVPDTVVAPAPVHAASLAEEIEIVSTITTEDPSQ